VYSYRCPRATDSNGGLSPTQPNTDSNSSSVFRGRHEHSNTFTLNIAPSYRKHGIVSHHHTKSITHAETFFTTRKQISSFNLYTLSLKKKNIFPSLNVVFAVYILFCFLGLPIFITIIINNIFLSKFSYFVYLHFTLFSIILKFYLHTLMHIYMSRVHCLSVLPLFCVVSLVAYQP